MQKKKRIGLLILHAFMNHIRFFYYHHHNKKLCYFPKRPSKLLNVIYVIVRLGKNEVVFVLILLGLMFVVYIYN